VPFPTARSRRPGWITAAAAATDLDRKVTVTRRGGEFLSGYYSFFEERLSSSVNGSVWFHAKLARA